MIQTTKNIRQKKALGAFYTPTSLVEIMTKWSIRTANDKVLEPSFGGCGFISCIYTQLGTMGLKSPITNIYGYDIDKKAFEYLNSWGYPDLYDNENHFVQKDFLKSSPSTDFKTTFDVIIGNPPYISHHSLSPETRANIKDQFIDNPFAEGVSKRASLWAYFVIHSLSFLRLNGRIAWVLPYSYTKADYGKQVKGIIEKSFSKVITVELVERLFKTEGTPERTIIVLAEGWRGPQKSSNNTQIVNVTINNLEELKEFLFSANDLTQESVQNTTATDHSAKADDLPIITLGSIGKIRIGAVTGANKFFLLNKEKINHLGLDSKNFKKYVSKFKQLNGLTYSKDDHIHAESLGFPVWLIHGNEKDYLSGNLKKYLDTFPSDEIETNQTFIKRKSWFHVEEGFTPDAFLTYMHHSGPRIVLNTCSANCVNSIHRITFNGDISNQHKMLLCISILSTFSQISAELVGRTYGSGVLKLEPSEAKKIKLLWPTNYNESVLKEAFRKVDKSIRNNNLEDATKISDDFFINHCKIKNYKHDLAQLKDNLKLLRSMRLAR